MCLQLRPAGPHGEALSCGELLECCSTTGHNQELIEDAVLCITRGRRKPSLGGKEPEQRAYVKLPRRHQVFRTLLPSLREQKHHGLG